MFSLIGWVIYALGWLFIGWLWWEIRQARKAPLLPAPDHLSCGECFWITRAQWLGRDPFPSNLPDQLVISTYCPEHGTFVHKRWKEKHLDDAGMPDNYRGFLE